MFTYLFSSSDIGEMAQEVEKAGIAFYQRIALLIEDKAVKDVLFFLSRQEAEHLKAFKKITGDCKRTEQTDDYVIDIRKHLQGLVESMEQTAFPESPARPHDIHRALEVALQVEKTTISLYEMILDKFISRFSEPLFRIFDEEKKHLTMIENAMKRSVGGAQ